MNLGLLGLLGGIGQGIKEAGAAWGAGMNEVAKEERSLISDQKKMKFMDDLQEAKRLRIEGKVTLRASEIAAKRGDDLAPAEAAYGAAGMLDDPAVKGGLEKLRAERTAVTPMDRLTAMAEIDPEKHTKDLVSVMSEERKAKSDEARTAASAAETARKSAEDDRRDARATEDRKVDRERLEVMWARVNNQGAAKAERPVYPKLIKEVDDEGKPYVIDQNTGAVGRMRAGTPAKEEITHWFKANEPATPEKLGKMEWTDSEGNPLKGGISSLYAAPVGGSKTAAGGSSRLDPAGLKDFDKSAPKTVPKPAPATSATPSPVAAPASAAPNDDANWINRGAPFQGAIYGGGTEMFQEQINKGTGEIRKVRTSQLGGLLSTQFRK